MALSFPYALDFLSNCLTAERIPLTLQRNDELSGGGDGRFWAAQMSRPLWSASFEVYSTTPAHAREINAKVYGLDGSQKTFLWCDHYYTGPTEGATGLGSVTMSGIAADRGRIAFSGLPAGFTLRTGDYLSIAYSTDRVYFGTMCEDATANGSGVTPSRDVRPHIPLGISTGATVELVRPYFKAIIPPGGFTPFANFRGRWGDSASITVLQKP